MTGLELGADDYVTKPFSLAVLRARVNNLLRRGTPAAAALELPPFSFDFERMDFQPGRACRWSCPRRSSGCCACWWSTGGRPCTRAQLLDRVWDGGRVRGRERPVRGGETAAGQADGRPHQDGVRPGLHLGGETVTPAVCGALALAALGVGFGLAQWLRARRLLARLDRMLADAMDGSFRESRFDESPPLRPGGPAGPLSQRQRRLSPGPGRKSGPPSQTLISDISHQTKTPIANLLLYASLLAEEELSPEQAGPGGYPVPAGGEAVRF